MPDAPQLNASAGPSRPPAAAGPSTPLPPRRPYYWRLFGLDTAADILSWRPGRKAWIFIVVSGTISAAIAYDRSEARRLRNEFRERARQAAEGPMALSDLPRKMTVLSSRLPDDATEDRAVTWFKRHVKPILNAAAIDYTLLHGNQPGGLARQLVERFRERRLADLDPSHDEQPVPGAHGFTPSRERARELVDGGTIIIGRPALKEYLWALKRAYLTDLDLERTARSVQAGSSEDAVYEEDLARELAEDGFFERALEESGGDALERDAPSPFSAGIYSGLLPPAPKSDSQTSETGPAMLPPASLVPPQPPLLLIPFSHPLGSMLWWPQKLFRYLFNTRANSRSGGEAALRLVHNQSRPLIAPQTPQTSEGGIYVDELENDREWLAEKRKLRRDIAERWRANPTGSADLDMGLREERFIDKSFRKWPANIAQARAMYEKELKPRIVEAKKEGGASESSLRAERLEKEARWRRNIEGWRIIRPGSGVAWDRDGMGGTFRVFADPGEASQ